MNERRNTMKKFILFYKGPATPPTASHEKWPAWFNKVADKLVDRGSPMQNGIVLHEDGSTSDSTTDFNGYSVIQAENIDEVLNLAKDHPFLFLGHGEYSVEIFELPKA
jgi:hypothetical protein